MAKRDRGCTTRRRILEAAAEVFEQQGFRAATVTDIIERAEITKGALYFHFPSKEDLAHGIFRAEDFRLSVPEQQVKLQELVDTVHLCARRLHTESLVRAGFRLTLEASAKQPPADASPFREWAADVLRVLQAAEAQGELLPHVDPAQTAPVWVSSVVGIHLMAPVEQHEDIPRQLALLLSQLLPSIAVPSVLTGLDLSPERYRAPATAPEPVLPS